MTGLLEQEGLAVYEQNPYHRRAKLLRFTLRGGAALRISMTSVDVPPTSSASA